MKFTKMQGTGNDFVVVETDRSGYDWSKLAVAMCDRHYGIGADGLLLLMPSAIADFRMRIFNADGSEAGTCGNGLICLVTYFLESRSIRKTNGKVLVETMAGIREAHAHKNDHKITGVTISMGKPQSVRQDIPIVLQQPTNKLVDIIATNQCTISLNGTVLSLDLVSIGNPHAVYFTDGPVVEYPLKTIGPEIERQFSPLGLNFEVARIINDQVIEARVWEHGVGETLACGSGACAITVSALLHGYIGKRTVIKLPGGELEVAWDGLSEVYLKGPAEAVFEGEWPDTDTEKRRVAYIKSEVLA